MYQFIDAEVEPVSGLTPAVVSDRTVRSIEFKLPEGAPAVPFDRSGRTMCSPSEGTLTREIRNDGADALTVELVAHSMGIAVKALWINRDHPDRSSKLKAAEAWGELRLIESLPPELRRAIELVANGSSSSDPTALRSTVEKAEEDRPAPKSGADSHSEHFIYSSHSFGTENGTHRGYLYLRKFIIGKDTLKNVYLTKLKESEHNSSYLLYDAQGYEIGPILESVAGLASDYVVGLPGIVSQLNGLGLLDRTGYKSTGGTVGRARGELRKLTGVEAAAGANLGTTL